MNPFTVRKTIRLVFHVVTRIDSPFNFTPADSGYFYRVGDSLNKILANLDPPSDPQTNICGVWLEYEWSA